MSQYQPPQHPSQQQPHPSQQPPPQPMGYQPPQGYQAPPASPGLFDTSFRIPITEKIAKTAHIAVMVLAGALVLTGLLRAIANFSDAFSLSSYGGSSWVITGVATLFLYPAAGFAVLTLGRLAIEYFVQSHRAREAALAGGNVRD
ncbi:MAG: DUF4282 domain-containing protein [Beutenbergiaceae bacterium]